MLSGKRNLDVEPKISHPLREQPLKERRSHDKHYEELASFFGVKHSALDSSRESDDLPEVTAEFQAITLEQKKRKVDQDLEQDEDKTKRAKGFKEEDCVSREGVVQDPRSKVRQVEGYYSNDDVIILLDALLKRDGFERIGGGDEQDIVTNLQTGQNLETMVLAPIAESPGAAIEQLGRDIERAYRHGIEQILVPINIHNLHWYTIQLLMLRGPGGYSLEAIIHDSLGIRKDSIIVEQLAVQGIHISQVGSTLPQIQSGEFGAKNLYCGGYTARLIANLATNRMIIGEAAWGCPNNLDHLLRQEDAILVSEYNFANAGNFGIAFIGLKEIMGAAQGMSLLRSFIAKEKEFKLLQELKAIYEALPMELKFHIKSLTIPADPAELVALVRDLHTRLPSVLTVLFKINALGEIEKDEEGALKLDTNLEIEQIHNIMVEFQRKCLNLERLEPIEDDGAEPGNQDMPNYSDAKPGDNEVEDFELTINLINMVGALTVGSRSDVATSLYNLGDKYFKLGKFKESIYYYEQALNIRRSLYESNHPEVAESLNSMGSVYEASGDVSKGIYYWEQALEMMQALYPDGCLEISVLFNNIGSAYETLGEETKGLAYMVQSLETMQALFMGANPDVATMLSNVGRAYESLGEERKGLPYMERALEMRQFLYHDAHPDVADSLDDVGSVYEALGDANKGLPYMEQALKMRQILYPDGNLDVADSLNAVGGAYESLGDARQGLLYMEQALKMMRDLYPGDSQEVVDSLEAVGNAYRKLGNLEKSLYYLEQALKMMQALRKGNNPKVATLLNKVGILHKALGDVNMALDYMEQALEMRHALYEGNHPLVANSLHKIGLIYISLGDADTGFDYMEQAFAMRRALFPTGHPTVIKSLMDVGLAYKKLGNNNKYTDYQNRAKRMKRALNEKEEFKGQGTLSYGIDSRFEYYNSALDQILNLRLRGIGYDGKAVVLKSRYFGEGFTASRLANDVGVILASGDVKIVLAPVNLYNQHWLGLLFNGAGTRVEVTYMDSEQRSSVPQLNGIIESRLVINSYENNFKEVKLERQRYNNCGSEVIENFVYYLTGTRATQEAAVYVHSLLVENSLLDSEEYGLKLEENTRLIGFLSNAAPLPIRSIGVTFMPSSDSIREPLKAFGYPRVKQEYNNGALGADGQAALNLLPALEQFNRLAAKWVQDKLQQVNAGIYKTTLGFKGLDLAVDSARLVYDPEPDNAKKVALDAAQLYGMYSGVNGYSALVTGAEVVYQLHLGEYQKARDVAAGTVSSMALPVILAYANKPYLGFVYSLFVAASTVHNALENTYSFTLELLEGPQATASKLMAGLDSGNNNATVVDLEP